MPGEAVRLRAITIAAVRARSVKLLKSLFNGASSEGGLCLLSTVLPRLPRRPDNPERAALRQVSGVARSGSLQVGYLEVGYLGGGL